MRAKNWQTALLLSLTVTLNVTAQSTKPIVSAVASVASYSLGPIAPGGMVVLFGTGLGPSQLVNLQLDDQGKVASILAEVQVLFDGIPAPLLYVSASQVAALVPFGVVGQTTAQVQVSFRGVISDPFSKPVASTAPAIFSADSSGKGQGSISNLDGSQNSTANPATPGSFITIYITGYGQTEPPGSDGAIADGIANVKAPVAVTIAGRSARVLYAGSSPGFVNGFAQVNAQIPSDIPYGGNLPIVVQVGDAVSQSELTVAIAGPPAPVPGAPKSLEVTPIPPNQIRVRWTPMDDLAVRFHVERQSGGSGPFSTIAVVTTATPVFTDFGVTSGSPYAYRVRAENEYGYSAYSNVASTQISIPQVAPPTNVQAVAVGQTQVNLSWNPANTNATSFQIERKTGAAGTYSTLALVASTVATFQDSTVTPSTNYVYRMRSQAASGLSSYSNESTVNTPALPTPSAPSLTATAISSSAVRLAWSSTSTSILRFRIERRTSTSQFIEIGQPGPTAASFDDSGLNASTAYTYRMRVETASGFSSYSLESTATTPSALPTAPVLQASAVSATQVRLSWVSTASGLLGFRLERRTATSQYTEINRPGPSATNLDDVGLSPSTTYFYRVRVETAAGLSGYSNEATAATPQGPPSAPTNLVATATSSTQVALTWTNNAPAATSVRIESRPVGSAGFTDVGQATTLSSGSVINLQANTSYTFRVRAQNATGFSAYSNESTVTTLQIPKTVFLVHGLGQGPADLRNLAVNLSSSYGLSGVRFGNIDYGFEFNCAGLNLGLCSANCTVSNGAQLLAQYIASKNPPGDIVLIGFSMGGLLARDLIANGRLNLNGRKIALVTIGTPNLGYPYLATDSLLFCSALVSAMDGNWRSQPNTVVLSPYLLSLVNQWASKGFPGGGGTWLAAVGRAYSDPRRLGTGCRDVNPFSDGVVCDDSAQYNVNTPSGTQPSDRWQDPDRTYVHSHNPFTRLILADSSDPTRFLKLWDPPPNGSLFNKLVTLLNGL
jgi:uncharacterized protein (TIGR03437 family)